MLVFQEEEPTRLISVCEPSPMRRNLPRLAHHDSNSFQTTYHRHYVRLLCLTDGDKSIIIRYADDNRSARRSLASCRQHRIRTCQAGARGQWNACRNGCLTVVMPRVATLPLEENSHDFGFENEILAQIIS